MLSNDSPEARNLRGIKLPLPCTSARELRKNMLKIKQSSPESWIIFRLFQRQISPHRAAVDLLAEIAQDRGPGHVLVRIAADLADHAICHPYLRSILMELISALHSFSSDTPHRWDFLFLFSLALGQIMTYGHEDLFNNDWSQDDLFDLKRDYISASAFCADVLNVVKHVRVGQEKTTSLDDAFDILRFAVEEEPSSPRKPVRHKNPDIDISAAATYMIHAGKVFFEASKRGSEECCITGKGGRDAPQDLATGIDYRGCPTPLWEGECGMSLRRWQFWKSQFELHADSQELQLETKQLARMAVRSMKGLEDYDLEVYVLEDYNRYEPVMEGNMMYSTSYGYF